MARKAWHFTVLGIALAASLMALTGVALRFTIRDSGPIGLGGLFFGLPLPVCAALFLGAALLSRFEKKRRWVRFLLAACIITSIAWATVSFKWHAGSVGPKKAGELRIGLWNAADNNTAFTRGSALIDRCDLDIMAFAEVNGKWLDENAAGFRESRSDWQLSRSGTLALAARGRIAPKRIEMLPDDSTFQIYEVALDGAPPLTVAIVDLGPNPLYRREPNLSHVLARLGEDPKNTIILGDFNTPYESVALDRFREGFYHCFTEAGRGFRETWPWPLPALSLDHIWVTRDWKPQLCRKVKRWSSDHAMVWTVLRPAPKSQSGQ